MNFIENRPISCNSCGYGPVYGREDSFKRAQVMVNECRWVCPRCNRLIRLDENEASIEEKA